MREDKLASLQKAIDFLDQCRADLENSIKTGALRDAVQWLEAAARELLADDAITQYYMTNARAKRGDP
jgi:HEPN domain-containing protein